MKDNANLDQNSLKQLQTQLGKLKEQVQSNTNKIEQNIKDEIHPLTVMILPIFSKPIMPSQITPIQIGIEWSDKIMNIADSNQKTFAIFSLGDENSIDKNITKDKFPAFGTLVKLLHAKNTHNEVHFICEGICRVQIDEWIDFDKSIAKISYPNIIEPDSKSEDSVEIRAYAMALVSSLQELLPLNPLYTREMRQYLLRFNQNNPSMLADCVAAISSSSQKELLEILATLDLKERLKRALKLIRTELQAAHLQDEIKGSVSDKISKKQKEFFLKEQLKEIKSELGIKVDDKTLDSQEFKKRFAKLNPPEHIKTRFDNEIQKLNILEAGSPEYAVTRNYLDVLTSIPWGNTVKENLDIKKARSILDKDHYGLLDIKDRIIEYLALGALCGETKGSILLFVGPPGVGKSTIGKSIAKALNRPFYLLSLGGINDASVIKGHRRTFIGSMPGKIIQAMRSCHAMNPVIMLDEIDKITRSVQGDPFAALLEALDKEQNNEFFDQYLDEKLDLSKCTFICTANSTDSIPSPLLDRMDVIRLSGYISEEKLHIAKEHLLPKNLKKANLKKSNLKISDNVLNKIIEEYARDSGVRSLERAIEKIIRKSAVLILEGKQTVIVKEDNLEKFLGASAFKKERFLEGIGIVTGLAWSQYGGSTIAIESRLVHKDGRGLTLTGSLGDVMVESAQIAYSYIQSIIKDYSKKKKDNFFKNAHIHIHVPQGATKKDGPSAGITIASSLLSLALNVKPKENFALTGELSLTGQVYAIGGIKEKVIAARRLGIFNIIVPKANEGDVLELESEITKDVIFYYANNFEDVISYLFTDIKKKKDTKEKDDDVIVISSDDFIVP